MGEEEIEEYYKNVYEMIPNVTSIDDLEIDEYMALFDMDEKTFVITLIPDAEPFDKEQLRELMDEIRLILSRA